MLTATPTPLHGIYDTYAPPTDTAYMCGSLACWGTTAARVSELKRLQEAINTLTTRTATTEALLRVSGYISAPDVKAVTRVVQAWGIRSPTAITMSEITKSSARWLAVLQAAIDKRAADAAAARAALQAEIDAAKAAAQAAPTPQPGAGVQVVVPEPIDGGNPREGLPSTVPVPAPAPAGVRWKLWAGVGVAVVALGLWARRR